MFGLGNLFDYDLLGGLFDNNTRANNFQNQNFGSEFIKQLLPMLDCSDKNDSFTEILFGFMDLGESVGGLVHLSSNDQFTIFNTENSPELPNNIISDIASDGNGGLWIGTAFGLAYWDRNQDEWITYDVNNSPLPHNLIADLLVVVILEACYTGTLLDTLQAPNRLIITSTNNDLAYYKDSGYTSFSNFILTNYIKVIIILIPNNLLKIIVLLD